MSNEKHYLCPVCEASFPSGVALGGHRKTHNPAHRAVARRLATEAPREPVALDFESMLPVPECFGSEDEWRYACQRLSEESDEGFDRSKAFREACAVCTVGYQRLARKRGVCHPEPGALTPERRAELGIDDLADEPWQVAV